MREIGRGGEGRAGEEIIHMVSCPREVLPDNVGMLQFLEKGYFPYGGGGDTLILCLQTKRVARCRDRCRGHERVKPTI